MTPGCAVNSDTAWAPGDNWRGAWGVTIEGEASPEEESFHEIRALPDGERVRVGGYQWADPISYELVPALLPGDVLRCTLDATRRLFSWRVVRSGITIAPRLTPDGSGGGGGGSGVAAPSGAAAHSGGPSAGGAALGECDSQPGDQPLHSPFSLPLCGVSAEEEDGGSENGQCGSSSSSSHGPPPLALAVGLKFAGDTVSIWRVVEGEAAVTSS